MHTLIPQLARQPADITIQRGRCAWGELWLARTPQGICQLEFILDGDASAAESALERHWPGSSLVASRDPVNLDALLHGPCSLHVHGTSFQHRVWAALLAIPRGQTRSYGDIAAAIGQPSACRAVGSAVGRNPVAILIPCHRVLAANHRIGGFYWGAALKQRMLADEGIVV